GSGPSGPSRDERPTLRLICAQDWPPDDAPTLWVMPINSARSRPDLDDCDDFSERLVRRGAGAGPLAALRVGTGAARLGLIGAPAPERAPIVRRGWPPMTDPFTWTINLGRWAGTQVRIHLFLVFFVAVELLQAAMAKDHAVAQTAGWLLML